jgi:splicing factor 3A subunit 1
MIPAAGVSSEINTSSSSLPVVAASKEGSNVTNSTISGDGKSSISKSSSSNVLLVKPPPDIRAVVDRTALFVSKNGRTFEQRILNSAKGKTPKFAFLYETSPFHAYYESRITFYLNESQRQNDEEEGAKEEGGGEVTTATSTTAQEVRVGELTSEVPKERNATEGGGTSTVLTLKKSKSSTIIDPISRELLRIRQRLYGTSTTEEDATTPQQQLPEPPPPFQLLHIVAPSTITSVQIEIIKLCAQFTAMARLIPNESTVGNTFLNTLRHREWNNSSTYGFLQPRHAHFAYYTALVDAYYQILLKGMTTPQDDTTNTNKPISIQDSLHEACYRAEYARYLQEQEVKRLAGDDHYAVVATVDWHDFVVVETIDFPIDEVVQVAAPPPPPPRKVSSLPAPVLVPEEDDEEEQEIRGDATTEHLHIVTDYTPRVVPTATAKELSKTTLMIDPISGKPISVADLSEHMRIQLLDPKWALEKKRFQEKQRESNLLSQGDDIAKNIRRLYSSAATSETSAYNKKISDTEVRLYLVT